VLPRSLYGNKPSELSLRRHRFPSAPETMVLEKATVSNSERKPLRGRPRPGLIDSVSHGAKFACAVSIGGDGNLHAGFVGQTSILGRQVPAGPDSN